MGKQVTLDDLCTRITDLEKRARRVAYLIKNSQFRSKYNDAPQPVKEQVAEWCKDANIEALLDWQKKAETRDLEEMTVKQLRNLARSLYIQDWNYLNKQTLIGRILRERASYELQSDSGEH